MADEYSEAFVRYLFEEDIAPLLFEIRRWRRHHHPFEDELGSAIEEH